MIEWDGKQTGLRWPDADLRLENLRNILDTAFTCDATDVHHSSHITAFRHFKFVLCSTICTKKLTSWQCIYYAVLLADNASIVFIMQFNWRFLARREYCFHWKRMERKKWQEFQSFLNVARKFSCSISSNEGNKIFLNI